MKLIHEQVQYIEFLSNDVEKTKAFYRTVFGWEFTDYGPEYTAFTGQYVDGGFAFGEPVAGTVLVILYSSALEETFEKVRNAGVEITKDIFVFPGGRRFQFRDPNGYELAVWSDAE